MKKIVLLMVCLLMTLSLFGCTKKKETSPFDNIKDSVVAKMELNEGTVIYVDSEIDSLKSIAYMEFAILEDPDAMEENWTYRITYNPREKVKNGRGQYSCSKGTAIMNACVKECLANRPELLRRYERSEAMYILRLPKDYDIINISLEIDSTEMERLIVALAELDLTIDEWISFKLKEVILSEKLSKETLSKG